MNHYLETLATAPSCREIDSGLALKSRGYELDTSPGALGFLSEFRADPIMNIDACKASFERDGYLFIKRFWSRAEIAGVRDRLTACMDRHGFLAPGTDPAEAIPHPDRLAGINEHTVGSASMDGIVDHVPEIEEVLYRGRIMEFFGAFLGGQCLHYDQIWFRSIPPGFGTVPHCDLVYMGRGTHNLFTAWVPWGDIDLRTGGLMILENSLAHEERLKRYLKRDVDEYCENRMPEHLDLEATTDNKVWGGWLSKNPYSLREKLRGRWLTSPRYEMGDLLLFSMKLVHASLDNQSEHIRISTDTRYQLASEPSDERWVGPRPRGHVGLHKRGRVC